MKRSNGIVVATDERLLLLSKGVFGSGEATEVPYSNVSEFSESADNPVLHEVKIAVYGGQNYELKTRKNDPTIPLLLRCITAKVSQKSQGGQNHRARIDTQWKSLIVPPLDRTPGEREMLYDLIEQDEDLLGVLSGSFGPDLGQANPNTTLHRGIIVATDKRILMLDKGVFGSSEVAEMPYSDIEAITYSTGILAAGFRITGRGSMHFRIENVQPKDTVKPFADLVRSQLPSSQACPSAPTSPASVADEIQKFASLLEQGYLTQDEFDTKKKELLHL